MTADEAVMLAGIACISVFGVGIFLFAIWLAIYALDELLKLFKLKAAFFRFLVSEAAKKKREGRERAGKHSRCGYNRCQDCID